MALALTASHTSRPARTASNAQLRARFSTFACIHRMTVEPTWSVSPTRPTCGTHATYWRRRAVAVMVLVGALALGALAFAGVGRIVTRSLIGSGPAAHSSLDAGSADRAGSGQVDLEQKPIATRTHVVVAGDTLWSIARSVQPHGDVRNLVDQLSDARHGRPLRVGERIDLDQP